MIMTREEAIDKISILEDDLEKATGLLSDESIELIKRAIHGYHNKIVELDLHQRLKYYD